MEILLLDNAKYKLWTPKDEIKDFHPMIREHSKEIFGENTLYFDVKHILKTSSGIGSIPDAYVIDLSKIQTWYVVENELSVHPIYDHIVKQLTKFINGIENQNARNQIVDMLYDEIGKDTVLRATVEKITRSTDLYRFLSKLVSKPPRIVVIIDKKTSEVEEACRVLKCQTDIVEFNTFVRENAESVHAHLFEPLSLGIAAPPTSGRERSSGKPKPSQYESWDNMLAWVDGNIRETTETLTNHILQLDQVIHKPSGRDHAFYKEKPSTKSIFVGFFLRKKSLKVRIRTDPTTFKDPKKWTGEKIFHWFFTTGQEKEFAITRKDQIGYAMELIKQSYALAK
ncbi:MAG TPA: hypothetical protein VMS94_02365 [Acidobacteriota bacterium]|nr:hypothetical protein [Acidobacteriota bacterium]